MEQELTLTSKAVAIIGAGPSGCACAKFLSDAGVDATIFDKGEFLRTILPTGGGRCNLANAIYDFKDLAKNYPRGEKFLYSVFSQFSTTDTLQFFKSIGIKTYTQKDNRIFPVSDSSAKVRHIFLKNLKCKFIKENVSEIKNLNSGFEIITGESKYYFDIVIIATGGHSTYDILKNFGLNIITPVQSLVGLVTKENFSSLAGVSIKNVETVVDKKQLSGDIIFTHKGISGPLIYTLSSIYARKSLPYRITLKLVKDFDFQNLLNNNPHKEIKNLISDFIPKSLAQYILKTLGINIYIPCHKINAQMRNLIYSYMISFPVTIIAKVPDGEVVTCGGVDLTEIKSNTMESKKYKGLYFCGEVLDIDGFCGGFNLQNCWSTAYVASKSIIADKD